MSRGADPAGGPPAIAVLGADGQVGHALVRALAPLGTVAALGRAACDLARPDAAASVVRVAGPRVVVNAAAYTAVDRAEDDAEACSVVNADAPRAIAAACADVGAAFVHFSTDYVFDGHKGAPYTEEDAPAPLNVYGCTKWAGERAVASATDAYAVFRTSWVYDPRRGHNFVRTIRRLAAERPEVEVVDDQRGAPTYAVLLAAAVAQVIGAALRAPDGPAAWLAERAGTYHLAATGDTSWYEFAEAVLAADAGANRAPRARVQPVPSAARAGRATRPANSGLDSSRAAAVFGVRLPHWREQLRLALDA